MPTFTAISVEHDTTPTIPFKFVYDDTGKARDVTGSVVTFTVYDDAGAVLFEKTCTPGTTGDEQTVTLSMTDTGRPPGGYYAELKLVLGGETLRWHGTFRIEGP